MEIGTDGWFKGWRDTMADPFDSSIAKDAEERGRRGVNKPRVRLNTWEMRSPERFKGEGRTVT